MLKKTLKSHFLEKIFFNIKENVQHEKHQILQFLFRSSVNEGSCSIFLNLNKFKKIRQIFIHAILRKNWFIIGCKNAKRGNHEVFFPSSSFPNQIFFKKEIYLKGKIKSKIKIQVVNSKCKVVCADRDFHFSAYLLMS